MVFFVVSLVVLVFSLCDYIRDSAIKRLVVLLLLVCLAVFSGFRGLRTDSYFGYDTNNYVIWFDGLTPFRFSGRLEFGFFHRFRRKGSKCGLPGVILDRLGSDLYVSFPVLGAQHKKTIFDHIVLCSLLLLCA